jgi:hypothetical protein
MKDNLDSIDRAIEEKMHLVGVLRLWDAVKEAGYSSDEVVTFSFLSAFLNKEQRAVNKTALAARKNPPYSDSKYHNCVRLKSGDMAEIPLTPRPYTPSSMKVSIKEKK